MVVKLHVDVDDDSKSTFAPDGSMLSCTEKFVLIHNLEKLGNTSQITAGNNSTTRKIAVVDGMVLVQKFAKKKGTLSTVKDLAKSFNDRLTNLTAGFSEVILVFDTYKPNSLKEKTREKRRQGIAPICNTRSQMIQTSSTFQSHGFYHMKKSKADLTDYLAKAILDYKRN